MAETISQYQITTFTSPVNGTTPIDANTVRGNDNSIRTSHNAHDADPGIHVQSSVLASRPAAGTAGRKWLTTDGLRIYYDTGSAWSEAAYLPLVGGTVTGATTFSAAVTMSSTLAVTGAITATGGVTGALTGNASTATALATARTLWGQSFDGTANVSGALTDVTTITASGAINGQTISATANFTGSVTVANGLTVSAGTSALQAITGTTLALSGTYTGTVADLSSGVRLGNWRALEFDGSNFVTLGGIAALQFVGVKLMAGASAIATVDSSGLTMASGVTLAAQALTATTVTGTGDFSTSGTIRSTGTGGWLLGSLAGVARITHGLAATDTFGFLTAADGFAHIKANQGTFVGLLTTVASAAGGAGFNLPHGAAPTAPANGDMWTTTAGLFVRINGVTKTVTLT